MTLLIKNAVVDGKCTDISVTGNKITAIAPGLPDAGAEKIIDCGGHLAATVPFYNTHTHSAMTLLRGMRTTCPFSPGSTNTSGPPKPNWTPAISTRGPVWGSWK